MILALLIWGALAVTSNLHAQAQLSWQDNSDNEDGFYIERSINGSNFTQIATLPADSTEFQDSDTAAGFLYQYRVQAFNAFGVSGYTNITSFEIPAPISYEDWIARFMSGELYNATPSIVPLASNRAQFLSETGVAPGKILNGAQLPNLLCYAHGINPFKPDYTLLAKPALTTLDGKKVPIIERAVFKYSMGLKTTLQESTDLITWTDIPFESTTTKETTMHRWENIILPDTSSGRFYRLVVSLASVQSPPSNSF